MKENINIALLDDESLFLEALSNLIITNSQFNVVSKSKNGLEFLDQLNKMEVLPDILLLDLNMKPINGLEVLEQMQKRNINLKIIVLSSLYNSSMYGYMIKYGISGFLPKYTEKEELFHAIEMVYTNQYYFNENNKSLLNDFSKLKKSSSNPWNMNSLTEKEIEVLKYICQELSTKEIAEKLFLSVKTIESHRSKIMDKIGCKNAVGMVVYAVINGIYIVK